MKFLYVKGVILMVLILFSDVASSKVKMPAMFTDGAVLQQQTKVAIWGWAEAKKLVTITTTWDGEVYEVKADKEGKFIAKVSTPQAGGPYQIKINDGSEFIVNDILIGEVWLCAGQSNMEMPMKGFPGQPVLGSNMDILKSGNSNLRVISVPRSSKTEAQEDFEGAWAEASPSVIRDFSATAYYFGSLMQEMLDVPVGLVEVSFGGSCVQAWMSYDTSVPFEWRKVPEPGDTIPEPNRTPTVLFNGMLSPVIGYGIKGCIWYQGETNYIEADAYQELFPTMVADWRKKWNIGDFAFYYAQIAPFDYSVFTSGEYQEKNNSAYLRDAQRKCVDKIPNSDMIVLLDVGEKDCIHPANKKAGGERFAFKALSKLYGMEGISHGSPTFKALDIKGSSVVIAFEDSKMGLTSYGKEVTGFEIAGKNKVFYPASVHLRAKSVVLSSPRVPEPVAVRYCFGDFVTPSLFGTNGIPVSSFRTDDW